MSSPKAEKRKLNGSLAPEQQGNYIDQLDQKLTSLEQILVKLSQAKKHGSIEGEIETAKRNVNEQKQILLKIQETRHHEDSASKDTKFVEGEMGLSSKLEQANKKIEELETEIVALKQRIIELETNQQDFKKMTETPDTGQLAFLFEQEVAKYVLPEGKRIWNFRAYKKMHEWLEEKKHTSQGQKAKQRWECLKNRVKWSENHEQLLLKLKTSGYAHPLIDLEEIRSKVPENFDEQEKKYFNDIVEIIEEVNENM